MRSRAATRNNVTRQVCECGNKATIKRENSRICVRCADIDSKAQPTVAGTKSYWGDTVEREYSVTLGGQP